MTSKTFEETLDGYKVTASDGSWGIYKVSKPGYVNIEYSDGGRIVENFPISIALVALKMLDYEFYKYLKKEFPEEFI